MAQASSQAICAHLEKLTGGQLEALQESAAICSRTGGLARHTPAGDSEEQLLEAVERTSRKIAQGEELLPDDRFIAEAIIIPDRRPAIDIIDGDYRIDHPDWQHFDTDAAIRARLQSAIAAVGRLDLPDHPYHAYGGTAFVVGPGLMMTNRHVAELFSLGVGIRNLRFRPGAQAAVDFLRERDRYDTRIVTVREVLLIHPYWDVAILRVEGLDADQPTLALPTRAIEDMGGQDVAVIGYPAFDPRNDAAVQQRVFGGIYNVKRLQPGKLGAAFRDVQSYDDMVPAATHDSSTLGGNSGSAVVSAASGEAVALHFGGRYLDANFAVPASALAIDSRVVDTGVRFAGAASPRPEAYAEAWQRHELPAEAIAVSGPTVAAGATGEVRLTVPLNITITLGPG